MVDAYVLLVLQACVLQGCGATLQKRGVALRLGNRSLGQLARQRGDLLRATLANGSWLLGLLASLGGSLLMLEAIARGDVTVVTPLANLNVAVATFLGVLVLGERLARTDWIRLGVLALGASLIARSRSGSTAAVLPFLDWLWLAPASIGVVALLAGAETRWPQRLDRELVYATCAGVVLGVGSIMLKLTIGAVRGELGHFSLASGATLCALLASPGFWLVVVYQVAAVFFLQAAYANGRVGVIMSTMWASINLTVALLGFGLLGERLDPARGSGIVLIVGAGLALAGRAPRRVTSA